MVLNELFQLLDAISLTLTIVVLASTLGIIFLYYKYNNGIIFRLGICFITFGSYIAIAVDVFNYTSFLGSLQRPFMAFAALVAILLVGFIGIYLNKTLLYPINKLIKLNQNLAIGDLSLDVEELSFSDEIGQLYQASKEMTSFLRPRFEVISDISAQLSASAQEIASSAEEINASSEEISSISQQMAKSSQEQMGRVNIVLKNAEGLKFEFNSKMQEINKANELIEGITNQINMLALNASIEAARAGQYGRGFAVVAENIRKLAQETRESVKTISTNVKVFQESLEVSIDNINNSIHTIVAVSEEHVSGTEETSAATEEQAATMQELAAAAQELTNMAETLEKQTTSFRLK
ncbi:MAG: methyl-accepting chemotaxis protein [Candidatus Hodarchaeota archaeon]